MHVNTEFLENWRKTQTENFQQMAKWENGLDSVVCKIVIYFSKM